MLCLSSRGPAGVLPPAGQIFEKLHFLKNVDNLPILFITFKQGLAGVLSPAGQIFEKLYLPKIFDDFPAFFVTFKEGVSRGAASGGSDL